MTDKPDANEAAEKINAAVSRLSSDYTPYNNYFMGEWIDERVDGRMVAKAYAEQSAELTELRAKLAKYDDATPIDEAFCEANGATLTAGFARTWRFPCGVEVIFCMGFEVCLDDAILGAVTTRGQLLHLLDGLGMRA